MSKKIEFPLTKNNITNLLCLVFLNASKTYCGEVQASHFISYDYIEEGLGD